MPTPTLPQTRSDSRTRWRDTPVEVLVLLVGLSLLAAASLWLLSGSRIVVG